MGAWIETIGMQQNYLFELVAPLVGAWIETQSPFECEAVNPVAPLVGAWIETSKIKFTADTYGSHPSWVRGLKLCIVILLCLVVSSHPSWVRGLKRTCFAPLPRTKPVAPLVGAWIETDNQNDHNLTFAVAPLVGAWIETSHRDFNLLSPLSRTPRGCVD